jgi:hypothetical protein
MIGGLVLGFGFLWTDVVCYTARILIGVGFDYGIFAGLFVFHRQTVDV